MVDKALLEKVASAAWDEGLADAVYSIAETSIGDLLVVETHEGVCRVGFPEEPEDSVLAAVAQRLGPRIVRSDKLTHDTNEQLAAYLEGDLARIERPVDLSLVHAPFRKIVLDRLLEIPRGEVVTYGELARRAGKPRAARAAGSSCATNPIPIIVPCHRVVPGSGGVGNYGGGPDRKWFLLGLEGAEVATRGSERGRT
jgi:methylated-DNA-[protein]-cysteine S-methyltransferase